MNEFIYKFSLLTILHLKLLFLKREKHRNNFSSQWRWLVACCLDGVVMEMEALTVFIKRKNENLKFH